MTISDILYDIILDIIYDFELTLSLVYNTVNIFLIKKLGEINERLTLQ